MREVFYLKVDWCFPLMAASGKTPITWCNERHWVFLGTASHWLTCQCDAVTFRWNWFNQKTNCLLCVLLSGCSALCGSGTGPAPGTKALLGNSLMHSVMKLALGATPDNCTIQKLAFSLLANLAMSHDCRGVLQKVSTEHTISTPKNLQWRCGEKKHISSKRLMRFAFSEQFPSSFSQSGSQQSHNRRQRWRRRQRQEPAGPVADTVGQSLIRRGRPTEHPQGGRRSGAAGGPGTAAAPRAAHPAQPLLLLRQQATHSHQRYREAEEMIICCFYIQYSWK